MAELMDDSQPWYTLYLSSNLVIQTQEIFAGGAIVEKMKTRTKPIKLEIPSSFEELMAIRMSHDPVRRLVQQMVPESCYGPTKGDVAQEGLADLVDPLEITPEAADAIRQAAPES